VPTDQPSLPPVLLIHGLGSSFEHNWQATGWVDLLEEEGRNIIAVNLPGHGPGATSGTGDTVETILHAISDHPVVDAVGFSAGGRALLVTASRHPQRFRRLAVLGVGNPGAGGATDGKQGNATADGLESDTEPEEQAPRVIRRLVESAGNDRRLVAQFLRTRQPALHESNLSAIVSPALIVIGDEDTAGPADKLVAELPDARLVTLNGVDHFATTSDFGCMDAVIGFISQ
jgi:pimeloyl-ACP methyl ester carboxylesterase